MVYSDIGNWHRKHKFLPWTVREAQDCDRRQEIVCQGEKQQCDVLRKPGMAFTGKGARVRAHETRWHISKSRGADSAIDIVDDIAIAAPLDCAGLTSAQGP